MSRFLPIALLLLSASAPSAVAAAPQEEPQTNILLVCIDTLRADHLGCHGYPRPTSPNIDRLAARGLLFTRAYSATAWTLPAVASMFSGLHPDRHRADHFMSRVSPQADLLAQTMARQGLTTAAVVGNYFLQPTFGLNRGFAQYNGECLADRSEINSACISDRAIRWLDEEAESGFFLYLHYFDPHYNYHEHEGFEFGGEDTSAVRSGQEVWELRDGLAGFQEQDRQRLVALYDSEVAFTDHHLGRVLDALERTGYLDDTLVIVTADHGESLGEHGWIGHTVQAYDETVRIPMILAGPGIPHGVRQDVVQIIDLLPTLLELFGIEAPAYGLGGESLVPLFAPATGGAASTDAGPRRRLAFLSIDTEFISSPRPRAEIVRRRVLEQDHWKLFVDTDENGVVSHRIFQTDAPKGFRKKDPAAFPGKVRMLLAAIEEEHQSRLAAWDRENLRRHAMSRQLRGVVEWPYKYLRDGRTGVEELYQLEEDPGEKHNRASLEPERVTALRALLEARLLAWQETALAEPPPMTAEESQALRKRIGAMGYTDQ